MPISQNIALFSLLCTFYGGDGKSTFALPNLTDSAPIHVGGRQPGPGLSTYVVGETGGTSSVTLLTSDMPLPNHNRATHNLDAVGLQTPAPAVNLAKSSRANA